MLKESERRFGFIAVGKGFITLEQLVGALNVQVTEEVETKVHRLIGQILIGMGAMNGPQIIEVLESIDKSQENEILL